MKYFFRKYPETILIFLAVLFLGIILWSFAWGINLVVREVNRAANANAGTVASVGFDLKSARGLDLRGLVKVQP